MKKKLWAILLCLVMVVGILPAAVMAAGDDSTHRVVEFTIVKKVVKAENAATPPAETFEFDLEDTEDVEKKSPATYGIDFLDEQGNPMDDPLPLKIETNGDGEYVKTVRAKIDMSHFQPGSDWEMIIPVGEREPSSYYKTFRITEKNGGKDVWDYSTARYDVTFKYVCATQELTCGVYEVGNDVSFRSADFTNTYKKQAPAEKTAEIPFTVTVKQGGSAAPGKQTFELEIFDYNGDSYDGLTVTASVETNGVKDYDGMLVITGPADQMEDLGNGRFFVREKNTEAANWTYSDAVWCVEMGGESAAFYPAELQVTDNGNYYVHDEEKVAEKMVFVNTYTENPPTGDNGLMGLWIALVAVSGGVVGAAAYSRKKKCEE